VAADRNALAVAEGLEAVAALGGADRRRTLDHGRVDEGRGRHWREHRSVAIAARGEDDRTARPAADRVRPGEVEDDRRAVGHLA
jgi:hypothetical protein